MHSTDTTVYEVLAEPNRRRILDLLREGERPVTDLLNELPIAQPTVSKHLKLLRQAGLVSVRQDAQRRFYQLRAAPLAEVDEWLEPYREHWRGRLDRLESHLDSLPE
ncbi:metalloregulator ArsR/SmtB family transcription factor [Amycolatopsis sp. NPDC004625]|uniref:ArsR/SmtB family transcription factor n=1 Tax=Amycolatopsis sp. NPDC004625 TaxID=3154670 RepID=UPI0033ABB2E4